ncbi:MAG: glycine cleavage T C-terminal barrel domain-containing protein [Actinomycetota bacterium]
MKRHALNPRILKSPFFESTVAAGAGDFVPYNGMWMPYNYGDTLAEYWATIEAVTLWDTSVQRIIEISGPDAAAFTSLLTPRDISKVRPGRCRYVMLTNQYGGIVNDPVMLRLDEDRFWLSTADSDVLLWAQGVAVFAGMDVEVSAPDAYPVQLQGPSSPEVVAALLGESILDLGYYHCTRASIDGIPVVVSRTGYSAEVGFEIYLQDPSRGEELWARMLEAGEPHGLVVSSPNRIRRIEAGILDYRSDVVIDDNPFQVGMDRLVDLDKEGGFIGQEALKAIAAAGVDRKMVGVFIDGEALDTHNENRWPVTTEGGEPAGELTAFVHSPRLDRNIGYVMAGIEHTEVGNKLRVRTPLGERVAEVTTTPFVDKDKSIPRRKLR